MDDQGSNSGSGSGRSSVARCYRLVSPEIVIQLVCKTECLGGAGGGGGGGGGGGES